MQKFSSFLPLVAGGVALLLVTRRWHGRLSMDSTDGM